jgi:serine/threonine protein kinase
VVALKRINTEEEENGFPITAIREVKILKALDHPNVVQLKEIVTSKGRTLLLYAEHLADHFHGHSLLSHWMFTVLTAHIDA